jgi:hypothetical protein
VSRASDSGSVTARDQHRESVARLRKLSNIGPAMARDLIKLGILCKEDLVDREPEEMYRELCAIDGKRHDHCVWDVFTAAVAYAQGVPARPWWEFTPQRMIREKA